MAFWSKILKVFMKALTKPAAFACHSHAPPRGFHNSNPCMLGRIRFVLSLHFQTKDLKFVPHSSAKGNFSDWSRKGMIVKFGTVGVQNQRRQIHCSRKIVWLLDKMRSLNALMERCLKNILLTRQGRIVVTAGSSKRTSKVGAYENENKRKPLLFYSKQTWKTIDLH